MNSLELWEQILFILVYLGLYFFVKKFIIAKYRK